MSSKNCERHGWAFEEGTCLSIDIALSWDGIRVILDLIKKDITFLSIVSCEPEKANFYKTCVQMSIHEPIVAVLFTPGHFSTILIHRKSKDSFIIYSFDSQGDSAKHNIEFFLEYEATGDNCGLFQEKNIEFEVIGPPSVRQKKDAPLCYAFAIQDALNIKKCLEQKIPLKDLHRVFFSSYSIYEVREVALIIYEILILKSYQISYEHMNDSFKHNEDTLSHATLK
ncbi:MAG: hypothetical protein PSV35_06265 [bacterium]|nr:hypothetical protein [bacterium]